MVPPSSNRISRVPSYSSLSSWHIFVYGAFTLYDHASQHVPLNSSQFPNWAPPISLATTLGISVDFFSCRYLDVSVPCVRLVNLCIQLTITPKGWVAPFGYLRFIARLSAPRSFSQISTSFFASYCLGSHHVRLFTWPYNLKSTHQSGPHKRNPNQSIKTKLYVRLILRQLGYVFILLKNLKK